MKKRNPSEAKKRIALVTGASSGIGREFAIQIDAMQKTDEIWLLSRNGQELENVAERLSTPAVVIAADLTDTDDISGLRAKLDEGNLEVTYLVNAAGFGKFGDWETISQEDIDSMIDLNCRALVDITRICLSHMGRGGHIIQVASAAAFTPLPHMNVYAASKAFVLNYTRALRWELHGKGIRVTALCPTWVKTGFEKVARETEGGADVRHLLGEQDASSVVHHALFANKVHLAVACASPQSFLLRLAGKLLPSCVTMAGWEVIRRI